MSHATAHAISAAGLDVERLRVEIATLNLANAHTVADADGRVYQPLRVVARAGAGSAAPRFVQVLLGLGGPGGVAALSGPTATVEATALAPRRVHEPGHPQADAEGYVRYAAVDPAAEMLTLMSATRAYEANIAALNAVRTMSHKALELGGRT